MASQEKGKGRFVEAIRTTCKRKATTGTSIPPPKWARRQEKLIILSPPQAPLTTITTTPSSSQLEDQVQGTTPRPSPRSSPHPHKEATTEAPWPQSI